MLVTATALLILVALFLSVPRLANALAVGVADVRSADSTWLAIATFGSLLSLLASAAAWDRGLAACGVHLRRRDVIRRYAAGSLANSLSPAHVGEVVRVSLLSRAMRSEGAVFTSIGVAAAVGLARVFIAGALFAVTLGFTGSLLWLAAVVLALPLLAKVASVIGSRFGWRRVTHCLDVFRGLKADPPAAAAFLVCLAFGTAARVFSAACTAQALGVRHPVSAALVMVAALELVACIPLAGAVVLTSAAVALTLERHGVPVAEAIGVGIGFQGVETLVGVVFGGMCVVSLASWTHAQARLAFGAAGLALLVGVATSVALGFGSELL